MNIGWIRTLALEVKNVVRRWEPDKLLPRAILIQEIDDHCFRLVLYSEWLHFQSLKEAVSHAERWMEEIELPHV